MLKLILYPLKEYQNIQMIENYSLMKRNLMMTKVNFVAGSGPEIDVFVKFWQILGHKTVNLS